MRNKEKKIREDIEYIYMDYSSDTFELNEALDKLHREISTTYFLNGMIVMGLIIMASFILIELLK